MTERVDVLVIGAGQAGLGAGYHLKNAGLAFLVVDAGARVGDSWRRRYASLTLFTPRQFSALPGLSLAGNREQYPTRDEFADYLESYALRHDLPINMNARVVRLERAKGVGFAVSLNTGETIAASDVIIATGGFQKPVVPHMAEGFGPKVKQLTVETYRDAAQVPPGTILVVGDGASGRDIAAELAATHTTLLATGKPRKLFPERLLGKSIWWWLRSLGLMRVTAQSVIGRMMRSADPFPDRDRNLEGLRKLGVRVMPRLVAVEDRTAKFTNGETADIAAVVWATGYRDDTGWIDIPGAVGDDGAFLHSAGVSPVPRLYFVGRPWQRNRASALVMGVGDDAKHIVETISRRAASGRKAA